MKKYKFLIIAHGVQGIINAECSQLGSFIVQNSVIIVSIKKGWQCNAVRERLTPCQSEDPSPTIPTHRMKEEKGKTVEDKKEASSSANKMALALLLKPASPTHLVFLSAVKRLCVRLVPPATRSCPLGYCSSITATRSCPLGYCSSITATRSCPLGYCSSITATRSCPLGYCSSITATRSCPLGYYSSFTATRSCPLGYCSSFTATRSCPCRYSSRNTASSC